MRKVQMQQVSDAFTLFVPSNSDRVAPPSSRNVGAKRSKVEVGQENLN